MLMAIALVALLASHFLLSMIRGGNKLSAEEALMVIAYLGVSLALLSALARAIPAWQRPLISIAYGVLLAVFFELVGFANVSGVLPWSREWRGVAIMGAFGIWGVLGHWLIALFFGANIRDGYWTYIKETYSTFRKT